MRRSIAGTAGALAVVASHGRDGGGGRNGQYPVDAAGSGAGAARTRSGPPARRRHAADLPREALGLWRGTVLADCPRQEWAAAEAAGRQETRRFAVEDLYTADLALGRHTRVVAELETLVGSSDAVRGPPPLPQHCW